MTPRLSAEGSLGDGGGALRFDCVVIGSGFGASVFAYRLAAALGPGRVAVLERGPELQPGEFPATTAAAAAQVRTPATPSGIFDLRPGRDMDALVANVLGGGSQLYAAVTLEPLPQTFDLRRDPADAGSARAWPEAITATALRPYFERVWDMLEVEHWADRDAPGGPDTGPRLDHAGRDVRRRPPTRRSAAFDRAVAGVGGRSAPVPLAINLTRHHDGRNRFGAPRAACTGCGDCVTGCNVGAKNSLTANYLPAAVTAGAQIHTGAEVAYLRPSDMDGYRWALAVRVRPPGDRVRTAVVHARVVVLGAGVFGTTGILFASRRRGTPVPPLLGTRVSGNGDAIMLASQWSAAFADALPDGLLDEAGPTITRMLDLRAEAGRRHLVQDAAVPHALAGLRFAAAQRALVLLTMGYDTAQGRLVEHHGRLEIRWPTAGRDPVQRSARTTAAAMAAALGSRLVVNPRLGGLHHGVPVTVHPLGGAPMGTGPGDGVVDDRGRLFRSASGVAEGVYVADASVIPAPVGANPSLTIAALAERAAEAMIDGDLERLVAPWA